MGCSKTGLLSKISIIIGCFFFQFTSYANDLISWRVWISFLVVGGCAWLLNMVSWIEITYMNLSMLSFRLHRMTRMLLEIRHILKEMIRHKMYNNHITLAVSDYQMFHISPRTIVLSNKITVNESFILPYKSQFSRYVLYCYEK